MSKEEASERERRAKIEAFTENLAEAALANGYESADEFVAAVSQMMGGQDDAPKRGRKKTE